MQPSATSLQFSRLHVGKQGQFAQIGRDGKRMVLMIHVRTPGPQRVAASGDRVLHAILKIPEFMHLMHVNSDHLTRLS